FSTPFPYTTLFRSMLCRGLAYEQKHEFAAAIAQLNQATGFCRTKCYGLMGQVSALAGDRSAALKALRQLKQRRYVSPWLVAIVYAELNDKDQTFLLLEKPMKVVNMTSLFQMYGPWSTAS